MGSSKAAISVGTASPLSEGLGCGMSEGRALRMTEVAAYLNVSFQPAQMRREGKLPGPDHLNSIGPVWKPTTIERWAERE
jgi:hypothetical protein